MDNTIRLAVRQDIKEFFDQFEDFNDIKGEDLTELEDEIVETVSEAVRSAIE